MLPLHVLGIAGSLRAASYNRALLRAARELAPEGMTIAAFELDDLPLYNEDLERDPPAAALEMRARIRAADALLIATPEYTYSISGVLKNAIDWGSQPMGASAWDGKPAAIFGSFRQQHRYRAGAVAPAAMPRLSQCARAERPGVADRPRAGKVRHDGQAHRRAHTNIPARPAGHICRVGAEIRLRDGMEMRDVASCADDPAFVLNREAQCGAIRLQGAEKPPTRAATIGVEYGRAVIDGIQQVSVLRVQETHIEDRPAWGDPGILRLPGLPSVRRGDRSMSITWQQPADLR